MDRTFAEVRAAFEAWARAAGAPDAPVPCEAAHEATGAAADRAAAQAMGEARAWAAGQHSDAAFQLRLAALILRVAAAAWLHGQAVARDPDEGGSYRRT